jgi:hypothetical protein
VRGCNVGSPDRPASLDGSQSAVKTIAPARASHSGAAVEMDMAARRASYSLRGDRVAGQPDLLTAVPEHQIGARKSYVRRLAV